MSQEEKVTIFLRSLAPAAMENVLAQLAPAHRSRLLEMVQRPAHETSADAVAAVLRELETLLPPDGAPFPAAPAANPAHAVEAYGAAAQAKSAPPENDKDPRAALISLEPEKLAAALKGENSRTICVVLNQLPLEHAGQLFKTLPGEVRREASIHFANTAVPPTDVLQRILQAVIRKTRQLQEKPTEPGPEARHRSMAAMIRLLDKPERKELLTAMEQHDPTTAAAVKSMLYCFEDLLKIENRSMQRLLAELDVKNLALALKDAEQNIKDKILSNMSQRARETLNEEIELAGAVPAPQVQAAQKLVVDTIQKLDQAGDLVMTQD